MSYLKVDSPNVRHDPSTNELVSHYFYENTHVTSTEPDKYVATPTTHEYIFKTNLNVPRTGLMLVGWGGNNGSTLTAALLANRHNISWNTRTGTQTPNYYGSMLLSSTVRLGVDSNGADVYVPFNRLVPMVNPNELAIGGWDISNVNLAAAMDRSSVLEPDLKRQLYSLMEKLVPLPSVYSPDFIAANQESRANNLIQGSKQEQLDKIRSDIRNFKKAKNVETVIVLWTANTERFASQIPGVNDSADAVLSAIAANHEEIAPSTLFAVASILEGSPFINGSPQNTLTPGVEDLAERHRVHIGGDDFKSGQTKLKSVLVDFLVNAGFKPLAISSYNHLGNNDGLNLSAPQQFRSKEISKSNVVDDMVAANKILYPTDKDHPDHVVVIKYVPKVGDSKRAMDEYVAEIFMGGRSTIAIHNTCEDSLLASPLILDLCLLAELMTRVKFSTPASGSFDSFHSVLSLLSYMLKAPMVPRGTPVVNALSRQRSAIENLLRALVGLRPQSDMLLEHKAFHT